MAAQPIAYWSTDIDATRTVSEIVALLVEYRAERTAVEWDNGQPAAVSFVIRDKRAGLLPVRLEAKVDAVTRLLLEEKPFNYRFRYDESEHEPRMRAQARRIVWRHLKDLIEQQLLAVKIGQYTLTDVFLGSIEVDTPAGASTLGAWVHRQLETGGVPHSHSGALMLPAPANETGQ